MDLLNIFGGSKKNQEIKGLNSQIDLLKAAVQRNFVINASANIASQNMPMYPTWSEGKAGDRYSTIDDIYSIIRKLVGASISVPMYPFFETNSKVAKQLKSFPITGNLFERKAMQVKALEDLTENDPVYKLLDSPSMIQNNIEFWEELYSFLYIFGKVPLIKMRPEGGVNSGVPVALEVLVPNFLIPKVQKGFPKNTITGYDYVVDGIKVMENIPTDDIIMIKYFNPSSSVSGLSPMEVLKSRITRLQSNMDTSVAQFQNGGVPGIVYDKDDNAEVGASGARQENFYKYLSNTGNKGAPYFGTGELGYIQLGLKLVDLDAANIANIDFKKLCNVWSVSDRLFNNDATGSEISDQNARRALYTDAALPNAFRVAAAIEESLNKDFKDKKRVIQADISAIPELQQDNKDLATWLSTAWWVTPNEKREMMKFDKLSDPMFDMPLVPTGLITLEDLQGSGDLPLTEDYTKP